MTGSSHLQPERFLAAWEANWKWGPEGALLISHSSKDLNLASGPAYYYSEFDHLNFDEVKRLKPGDRVERGQRLARVHRPGGHSFYLPEVHWEVWEAEDEDIKWKTNTYDALAWSNRSAVLIDPLYMLALHAPPNDKRTVKLTPFIRGENYSSFLRIYLHFRMPAPIGVTVLLALSLLCHFARHRNDYDYQEKLP